MKKAQTWSLDVMIAIFIFIVVIIGFFYIIDMSSKPNKAEKLKEEGETVPDILISSGTGENQTAVLEKKVDEGKIDELVEKSKTKEGYENLKKELGIDGEFYIHFEDDDGNIIYINESAGTVGIGSDSVTIKEE
ncbi:hypothetical protein FP803_00605 [Candidatus Woesearchaeota archaeon]|nr:hypothetical protein [Candidatus Woesearchaeota archaeon]MBU3941518.1 hypothetical protein [Nanoarchaeota archaeon]